MRGARRWLLVALAVVVALVALAVLVLPRLVDTPRIQGLVAQHASQAVGRPVTFKALSLSLLPRPSVVLRGLEIAEDPAFGRAPFLTLDRAEIRLRLRPLLLLRVELGDFVLREPQISLAQAADGRWNIASLGQPAEPRTPGGPKATGGAGAPAALLGSRVRIVDGRIKYESRAGAAPARYSIEGLNLTLSSGLRPIAFEGEARVRPGDLAVTVTDGTLALVGARSLLDAPLKVAVAIEGKDVGPLLAAAMGPEPSITGGVRGTLTVAGALETLRASGEFELTRPVVARTSPECPEPKRRTLTLGPVKATTAWDNTKLTATSVTTGLGGGTLSARLTATPGRGVVVELTDIAVKGVPVETVLVDFLCQGYAVEGPLDLTGRASARLDDPWHTLGGAGQLRIGPGKVVGAQALALLGGVARVGGAVSSALGAELPVSLGSSPIEFESITGTYRIAKGVVATDDLRYTSRALNATVVGTYALATGAMDLDVLVKAGRSEVKAKITGTAAAPSVKVDPRAVLRDVDPRKVERGLKDLLKRFR